jgi:hypothetical protein
MRSILSGWPRITGSNQRLFFEAPAGRRCWLSCSSLDFGKL